MAGNHRLGRFTNETPEERERWIEIQCEQRRRRRQQEKAEQREHRLVQRRQHRPQETRNSGTEDLKISDKAISRRQRNRGTGGWSIRGSIKVGVDYMSII